MLHIIGDARLPQGSGEPEHLTLRRPVDRQCFGPCKASARERWRLPPFEDGTDDIQSKTAKPSELRKVVQREPLFRSDLHERSITCGGDRHPCSMGIGHQPDQAFVPPRRALRLKPRLHQPGLPAGSDQRCRCVDHDPFVHMQLDPVAVDIDALNQRGYKGSSFMLRCFE